MLARIANNLFWMARYLERSEHITRYTQVHFFSSIDAPLSIQREQSLLSILNMSGSYSDYVKKYKSIEEYNVINFLGIDDSNPISIKYCIEMARENARGARDSISTELWESINTFYHYINNINRERLIEEGIYEYTNKILYYNSIINGYIDQSLIRDSTWSVIRLGQYIERSGQIIRMILNKLNDLKKIPDDSSSGGLILFEIVNLLKSTETYDMSKIFYKNIPNKSLTLEFLTLNQSCPKSIVFNLKHIKKCIDQISLEKDLNKNSLQFQTNKMLYSLFYTSIEEIDTNEYEFYIDYLKKLNTLSDTLEKKYFTY
jgi:uncharacterized alpha-E superfamily protein